MVVNGNGVASSAGKQLLQIIPINIVTMVTVIACAVGLYYKFDARISALERSPMAMSQEERKNLMDRLANTERKLEEVVPTIIETNVNVLFLMDIARGKESRRP